MATYITPTTTTNSHLTRFQHPDFQPPEVTFIMTATEEFNSPMESPTQHSRPNPSNRVNYTSEVLTSLINEEKERSRRSLNVIVHNVAESSAESGPERKSHVISIVTSIFDKYVGLKLKSPMLIG